MIEGEAPSLYIAHVACESVLLLSPDGPKVRGTKGTKTGMEKGSEGSTPEY